MNGSSSKKSAKGSLPPKNYLNMSLALLNEKPPPKELKSLPPPKCPKLGNPPNISSPKSENPGPAPPPLY